MRRDRPSKVNNPVECRRNAQGSIVEMVMASRMCVIIFEPKCKACDFVIVSRSLVDSGLQLFSKFLWNFGHDGEKEREKEIHREGSKYALA